MWASLEQLCSVRRITSTAVSDSETEHYVGAVSVSFASERQAMATSTSDESRVDIYARTEPRLRKAKLLVSEAPAALRDRSERSLRQRIVAVALASIRASVGSVVTPI